MNKVRATALGKKGFTLLEILVVIGVLSVIGVIVVTIFTRTLKGNNRAQLVGAIKQNGQAVLENMSQIIRNADNVVCVVPDTIVVVQSGQYTRYKFISSTTTANGYIKEDFPTQPTDKDLKVFIDGLCAPNDTPASPQILTDTNPQTGVSIENGLFTKTGQSGSKDAVTVKFDLLPGKTAPAAVVSSLDAVNFQTTIQLR